MCDELAWRISGCSESAGEPVAQKKTLVIPTELSTTNKVPRTDEKGQGNLLHDYKRKLANLPDHLQLIKLCSVVGITKTVARRQYFTTLDDAELDKLRGSFREYTPPRDDTSSKVKGWIRGNTKIGPAWGVAVSHHEGRHGIGIMINSFFGDGTRSRVMIVNGRNKYVTEMSEKTQDDHIDYIGECTGKPVARARPKQTSMTTTSSSTTTLPYHLRVWIDVEPGPYDKNCSKCQTRWSGCFDTILQYLEKKTEPSNSESWHRCFVQNLHLLSIGQFEHGWNTCKKEEVLRSDSSTVWIHTPLIPSCTFEQLKATLEENTSILHCKTTCCYRATSPRTSGGQDVKKGRHAVFFTAVNPMYIDHYRENDCDMTKPKIAVYKQTWKIRQNTVYWCNLRVAQSKGLQFFQTRSNAIILHNTLHAMCIEKVVVKKSGEELYNKTYQSPTAPQRFVLMPNVNYERQDTTSSDARTTFDHSDKHGGTYKETCRGEIDFRIQGLHYSAVQEHDRTRKQTVHRYGGRPSTTRKHLGSRA